MEWDYWVDRGLLVILCVVIPGVFFIAAMQTKSITRKSMRVLLGVGVVVVYLALVAGFLFPRVGGHIPMHGARCFRNIHKLREAQVSYAQAHSGRFADSFGPLFKEGYLKDPAFLSCRFHDVPDDFPRTEFASIDLDIVKRADEWADYAIVPGLGAADPPNLILIYDKVPWGRPSGRNCVLVGKPGTFDDTFLTEDKFQKRMKEQEAKLHEMRQKRTE